ncbi:serine/threonine-protein kinase [Cerasicoccus fimbriatus]|uniref:serine/threonine-protein kinase n=1 Tax=Cerasicoccus fimbriatus TaxID=3014554 RepID=UPI0022B4E25E|nr:serine/threonine-protein kinase [Cerasicoccus sp. TK19100]
MSNPERKRSPHAHLAGLDPAKLIGQGAAPAPTLPELPGYEIIREIGRGGMGVVFLANQQSLDRQVAIKQVMINADADPAILERLEREARIMARLSHPNIVTVHHFERTSDYSATIVMAYVAGGNLRDQIDQHKQGVPLENGIQWLREIAQALSAAHAAGVAHRDIKPENVLLSQDGHAQVTDFGLALPMDQQTTRLTHTGSTVGTVDYMAPEVLYNADCDLRSDLYSLGVIGYELLTGKVPRGSFAPPHEARPDIPKATSQLIMAALRPDPAQRPQSAEAFATALTAKSGQPIKFGRLIALAVIALICGLVFAIWSKPKAPTVEAAPAQPSARITPEASAPARSIEPAPAPASPEVGPWQPLLNNNNPDQRLVSGHWQLGNGYAESNGDIAILALRQSMPAAYDVELEFTRMSGRYSIALFFAANGSVGSVDVDGWDDHLSGVQSLNGVDLRNGPNFIFPLNNGTKYTLLVQVRPEAVTVFIDGQEYIRTLIEGRRLDVVFPWEWSPTTDTCSLAIGSYQSPTTFEDVRWRAVSE